jgi:sec-independent protein translocase protein TatA
LPVNIDLPELLIGLVVVILLFGAGWIGKIAGELGSGIRAFKNGLKSKEEGKKRETSKVNS